MSNKYFSEYATFRKQEPLASKHSRLSALQTLTITVALWVKLPKPSFFIIVNIKLILVLYFNILSIINTEKNGCHLLASVVLLFQSD